MAHGLPRGRLAGRPAGGGGALDLRLCVLQVLLGHRARIGYTSPPLTTEVFPYEFYRIVPAGVTLVIATLAIGGKKTTLDEGPVTLAVTLLSRSDARLSKT